MGQCDSKQSRNSQDQLHTVKSPVFHLRNPTKPKFQLNNQFLNSKNENHNHRVEKEIESQGNRFMIHSLKSSVNIRASTNLERMSDRDLISTVFRTGTRRVESPTENFNPISLRQVKIVKRNLLNLAKGE